MKGFARRYPAAGRQSLDNARDQISRRWPALPDCRHDRDPARSDQRRQHEKRDDNEREAHGQNDQHRPTEESLPRLGWVKLGVIKLPSAHDGPLRMCVCRANVKGPRAVPECAAVDNSDAQQPRYHAKPFASLLRPRAQPGIGLSQRVPDGTAEDRGGSRAVRDAALPIGPSRSARGSAQSLASRRRSWRRWDRAGHSA
jgi:hypothetical protein